MDTNMMETMKQPCACGSGKMAGMCCMKNEAMKMMDMPCPCGSGQMAKACCMKEMAAHMDMPAAPEMPMGDATPTA